MASLDTEVTVKANIELSEATKQMIRTEAIQGFLKWLEQCIENGPIDDASSKCPMCQLLYALEALKDN